MAASPLPLSTPFVSSSAAQGFARAAAYAPKDLAQAREAKARDAAQDFEAVFLNEMFSQMFTSIEGEGPFGGGQAVGVWRSFLTDEYAKSFARKGGIGIADHVYRSLMQQQEIGA
jgi:Rod binding domain-containing protein